MGEFKAAGGFPCGSQFDEVKSRNVPSRCMYAAVLSPPKSEYLSGFGEHHWYIILKRLCASRSVSTRFHVRFWLQAGIRTLSRRHIFLRPPFRRQLATFIYVLPC